MVGSRTRWAALATGLVAGLVAVLVAGSAGATPVGTVDYQVTNEVSVMAQGCDQVSVASGSTIKCGVKIVGASSFVADEIVIAVRDPSGAVVDFPGTTSFSVTTSVQTYESSKAFTTTGTYQYFFAYRRGTQWTNEEPTRTFTVTAAAPASPAAISQDVTPNPALTGQTVTASAQIWAQPQTVNTLVWACRTSTGGNCDFGHQGNFAFTGSPQTFAGSTSFTATGTYTLWVAYEKPAGSWHDLSSTMTLTVSTSGGGGGLPTDRPQGATGPMTLKFNDEFSGTAVDTTKWGFQSSAENLWCQNPVGTGNPGNQQLEFDKSANATVSSGTLKILAKPESIDACGRHYNWSSALLTTQRSASGGGGFNFRYGWMEASMKFPPIKGFWPAWWTWQDGSAGNSTWDETDAVEYYSDNKTRIYQSSHASGGGGCDTVVNTSWGTGGAGAPFDPSAGFHVYAANITSTGTDFYVDGIKTCHAAGVPSGLTNVILDNFVYSQIPPASGTQGTTEVDWVRVWQ